MWKWCFWCSSDSFCPRSRASFTLAPGHQTVLVVKPCNPIRGNLSTRLLLHFLLDSIAVVGGVIAAINWGLLFSLFSITVLFWTLLVWFPLCRNKAGQNTYFIFCAEHLFSTCYSSIHSHFNTTPQLQYAKPQNCHRSTEQHQISSSWQIQFMTQHAKLQSAKGRGQCRCPFRDRLPSCNPVVIHFKHASFSHLYCKRWNQDRY